MRILYFSDIHCEVTESMTRLHGWTRCYPLSLGPDLTPFVHGEEDKIDACILAGDIATVRERRGVSTLIYAEQVADMLACPVFVIPGNHEYYGGCFEEDRSALRLTEVPGVTVLDRDEGVVTKGDQKLRILGATLWTDYKVTGNQTLALLDAAANLNDHQMIQFERSTPRRFAPQHALAEHERSREWLAEKLAEPFDGATVIATHHCPHSQAGHALFAPNRLSPCFQSDCDDTLELAAKAGVKGWIYGHHHWSQTIEVNGVPTMSAQMGYPRERSNWSGPGVLTI